ncbi:MAG: nucleoside-diphosphate kinase [Candidatus Aminicenantes bacterium]|nr:nucleoside-diphosphate kinase [Candidatus Aminicenantes bacterium]
MNQSTLGIVKPDAVKTGSLGAILKRLEAGGLTVAGLKMVHLTRELAQGFYAVHRDRPFFDSLTDFMSEGPCVVMVLKGENAIDRWRALMGATDPGQAGEGTIRKDFGQNIERNAVHGSDSPESANFEIAYFFNALELSG